MQPGHETSDSTAGAWNNYRLPSFPSFEKSSVWPAAEKPKGSADNISADKPVVNVDVYPSLNWTATEERSDGNSKYPAQRIPDVNVDVDSLPGTDKAQGLFRGNERYRDKAQTSCTYRLRLTPGSLLILFQTDRQNCQVKWKAVTGKLYFRSWILRTKRHLPDN